MNLVAGTVRSHMRPGSNSSDVVAPAVVKRYGKGTDSDATDAMVVGTLAGHKDRGGWRIGADEAAAGQLVAHTLRPVRRLTPTECERLQGFPDGWTVPYGPSLAHSPSENLGVELTPFDPRPDGPRYSAMGDAVTVPVLEWIGRRVMGAVAEAA